MLVIKVGSSVNIIPWPTVGTGVMVGFDVEPDDGETLGEVSEGAPLRTSEGVSLGTCEDVGGWLGAIARVTGAKEGASDGMTVEELGSPLDTFRIVGTVEEKNSTTGAKEYDGKAEGGSSVGMGDSGALDGWSVGAPEGASV